jgi:hypothetical protein
MEHLTTETLARLVDEQASAEEATHVAECAACAAELEALKDQTAALGGLADLRPPRGAWETLEAHLVSEGLVRSATRLETIGNTPGWMKIAAAIVLFVGGTGTGLALARGPAAPLLGSSSRSPASPFAQASDASSVDEAAEVVRMAERQYMDALIRYRQMLDAESGDEAIGDPEARYAALEYLVAATQAAMQQAPADPFLNGLLASTLAERQAARQEWAKSASQGLDWY